MAWPWIAVSCLFTFPFFFIRAFVIPSGAMEDTLLIGDKILSTTFPRPVLARGDLVVFRYPVDPRQIFVKRVVGIGGDRVHITARVLYRNGHALREPYVVHKFPMMHEYGDNCPEDTKVPPVSLGPGVIEHGGEMLRNHVVDGEIVIPAGSYFVLGDNRDNSLDSRYWGFLTDKDVIGKPFLIYDSTVPATSGETAANRFRGRTRWHRLLKLL